MNRAYIKFKYVADFFLALIGLIILSPLFAGAAIAIKCESKGKIILKQRRTGQYGKKFYCYKFRTMVSENIFFDKNASVIRDDNPHLTKVGKFLRKFKMDELPQLINVIKGEMCLIAPRPLLPVYDSDYEPWELVKFEIRPGITGLGQVCGNGHLDMKDRKYYDAYYAMHASFGLDIKIFFRTLGVILFGEARYLRPVNRQEYRRLKREVKRCYTVQPKTVAHLRSSFADR